MICLCLFVIEIRREMRQQQEAERACWDFLSGWQEAEADVGQIRKEEDNDYGDDDGDDIINMTKCLFVYRDAKIGRMMMKMMMVMMYLLRYESSTLILYKELSSSIFQSCQSVSQSVCQASVTPVQISTFCNI